MFFKKSTKKFQLDEVLEGCRKGRGSAQKQLFERYYGLGMSVCLRYAANRDEAEEMLNDGFLKVFSKIEYYDATHAFEAWFRTVMVRTSIDYFRKHQKKVVFMDVEDASYVAHNDDNIVDKLSADEIMELVQKLPPAYRMVFSLYAVEGYSHSEIAELLQINEGTSRSNLSKARVKMQEWIKIYVSESSNYRSHGKF